MLSVLALIERSYIKIISNVIFYIIFKKFYKPFHLFALLYIAMLQPLASKGRTHADISTTISDIVVDMEVEEPRSITSTRKTTPKQAEHIIVS